MWFQLLLFDFYAIKCEVVTFFFFYGIEWLCNFGGKHFQNKAWKEKKAFWGEHFQNKILKAITWKRGNTVFDPDSALWFCQNRQHQLSSNCHSSTAPWSSCIWKNKLRTFSGCQEIQHYGSCRHICEWHFFQNKPIYLSKCRWSGKQMDMNRGMDIQFKTWNSHVCEQRGFSTSVNMFIPLLTWTWNISWDI